MKTVSVDWGDCPWRDNGCQAECHALQVFEVPDDWDLEKCKKELQIFPPKGAPYRIESSQVCCYNAYRGAEFKFIKGGAK